MIYFIQENENGPIKIGCSYKPSSRLKTFQTGNSRKLIYLGDCPGNLEKENELHDKFQKYRTRHDDPDSEWFEPNEEIIKFINENCRVRKSIQLIVEPNGNIKIIFTDEIELSGNMDKRLFVALGNFRTNLTLRFEDNKKSFDGKKTFLIGLEGQPEVLLMQLSELGLNKKVIEEINLLLSTYHSLLV